MSCTASSWHTKEATCILCTGTGLRACGRCKGSGHLPGRTCHECNRHGDGNETDGLKVTGGYLRCFACKGGGTTTLTYLVAKEHNYTEQHTCSVCKSPRAWA